MALGGGVTLSPTQRREVVGVLVRPSAVPSGGAEGFLLPYYGGPICAGIVEKSSVGAPRPHVVSPAENRMGGRRAEEATPIAPLGRTLRGDRSGWQYDSSLRDELEDLQRLGSM